MRILVINQYFPPDASSTAYILGELAEDLGEVHEVCVIAGRPSYDAHASAFRPRGVNVVRVRSTTFSRASLLGRVVNYTTFLLASTGQAVRGPRPELVLTMTDPPLASAVGALAAARHRCAFVILLHDLYPDIAVALGILRQRWVAGGWRRLNAVVWRAADIIVVVGRDMAAKLESEGVPARKLRYIPTWSEDFPASPSALVEARRTMGWDGRFVVMHAGNQGLAQNVRIFARLAERLRDHPEILVVMLGNGAGRKALETQANRAGLENLVFMDARPKDEAQLLMAAADLHVISLVPGLWGCAAPSKTYGIMAAGRPFIAAVDPGAEPDLVQREFRCGASVAPGDDAELARAILRLRTEPLGELGHRAYSGFTQRFRKETVLSTIRRVLEEVVADRR